MRSCFKEGEDHPPITIETIWEGRPPQDERLKQAFNPWLKDQEALGIIYNLICLGRRISQEEREGKGNPQEFNAAVEELFQDPKAAFLFEDHPTLGAKTIAVVRWAVGPAVGGKPISYNLRKSTW